MRGLFTNRLVLLLLPTAGVIGSPVAAQPPTPGAVAQRPASVYSCMTVDPADPPMVDVDVPSAVEARAPGRSIHRDTSFSVPGLTLWRVEGQRLRPEHPQRASRLLGHDAERDAVVDGAALWRRFAATGAPPRELARAALAMITYRAGQRPLSVSDAASLGEWGAPVVDPHRSATHLVFWARASPALPYPREIRIELSSGRANVGAHF